MRKKKRGFLKKGLFLLLILVVIISLRYIYLVKKQVNEVNSWRSDVVAIAQSCGIEEYTDITLAIILTESKGNHIDLMQSSESKYGEKNKILTSEESLESGITHLAEVIDASNKAGTDVWTGVQAYNFGLNYIPYVKENGGVNSIELAEEYSKTYLAPTLGNTNGTKYKYVTPRSLKYNGGYLYENGGNFFYADIVRWNMSVIKNMSK